MIDVLVVGGGPAGLATAVSCTLAGLSVTVAEPRTAPVDKACGEGLMPAAVRRLEALGVPLAAAPAAGRRLLGIRYLDASHQADALFRHGTGLGVRRIVLHAALSQRAAALGIPVLPVRVDPRLVVRGADRVIAGGVEARYLVAADGLHSAMRRHCWPPAGPAARRRWAALRPGRSAAARYGLRQHYRITPWTDLVEVHWAPGAEAYVTPVGDDTVGVALLFSQDSGNADGRGFAARLAAFPALRARLAGAAPASAVRGAGPLRHDVSRRVRGRVLLVGDASGYLDALTGEGIGVALAQASALASCLAADRPADYERAWRRVSGPAWRLTAGLLWSRNQSPLAPLIVPAAARLPWLLAALVNQAARA
jgi:flavin-dependent dehydrogenase